MKMERAKLHSLKFKKYGFCKECGERFDKKSANSKQIYCKECAKKIQQIQKNEWKRRKNLNP